MITLQFPGMRPQSKRNSQFANGRPYVEPHYKRWRNEFGLAARMQWRKPPLAEPVAVAVVFKTASGLMRGDLDNAFAGCADGLMDGGVLADDKWIKRLAAEVVKVHKSEVGISITIERLHPEAPGAA
jgi:Holliday junction resolvase RusA-like endonuclease